MLRIMFVVCVALSVATVNAAQREWSPKEIHDELCRESDLSSVKDDKEAWREYQRDCAPRASTLARFGKTVAEYLQQCRLSKRLRSEAMQHPRVSTTAADVAFLKCETVEDLMRGNYLELYELERQQVFKTDKARMLEVVVLRCPHRHNPPSVRRAFARCHIHIGFQEHDGRDAWVDSLPKSVHKEIAEYEASLKKRGLWVE